MPRCVFNKGSFERKGLEAFFYYLGLIEYWPEEREWKYSEGGEWDTGNIDKKKNRSFNKEFEFFYIFDKILNFARIRF